MLRLAIIAIIGFGCAAARPAETTPAPPSSSACPTICADYINECSMMYGGCFPDPKCTGGTAWPTFTAPPCPSITKEPSHTPTPPTYPSSACSISICYDNINECGQMFGGCTLAPECGGPVSPTFSRPSCSLTNEPTATPYPTASPSACDMVICYDYLDKCGQGYGGCTLAPECGGPASPTFSTPSCSLNEPTPASVKPKPTHFPTKEHVVTKTITKTVTGGCDYPTKKGKHY